MTTADVTRDFLATLNAYTDRRVAETFLAATAHVAAPRKRRRYRKTARWHEAQRARRVA